MRNQTAKFKFGSWPSIYEYKTRVAVIGLEITPATKTTALLRRTHIFTGNEHKQHSWGLGAATGPQKLSARAAREAERNRKFSKRDTPDSRGVVAYATNWWLALFPVLLLLLLPLMLLLLPSGAEGAGGGEPKMPGR